MGRTTFLFIIIILQCLCGCHFSGKQESVEAELYSISKEDIRIRDPFVFVDKKSQSYYIPANAGRKIKMYKSKDLENWKEIKDVFVPDSTFWGKTDFWAPDLYEYEGKYYLFVTFSGSDGIRGTSILVSDSPEGNFHPLTNEPATPHDWMALDGALYIDGQQQPWMLYCREWLQVEDGEIVVQKLSEDLKQNEGDPIVLFKASEASWTKPFRHEDSYNNYITDAPIIHKTNNGRLIMTWSSLGKNDKYCIGISYSDNGLFGPWIHQKGILADDDGGHGMILENLQGELMISYHAPNSQTESLQIKKIVINETESLITVLE